MKRFRNHWLEESHNISLQTVSRMSYIKGAQIFQISRNHLNILGTRIVTWSKLHAEDPQILSMSVQNFSHLGSLLPRICAPLSYIIKNSEQISGSL